MINELINENTPVQIHGRKTGGKNYRLYLQFSLGKKFFYKSTFTSSWICITGWKPLTYVTRIPGRTESSMILSSKRADVLTSDPEITPKVTNNITGAAIHVIVPYANALEVEKSVSIQNKLYCIQVFIPRKFVHMKPIPDVWLCRSRRNWRWKSKVETSISFLKSPCTIHKPKFFTEMLYDPNSLNNNSFIR